MKTFPSFKNHLDIFLARIPNQPTMSGLARGAVTNSLWDQIPLVPDLDLNGKFVTLFPWGTGGTPFVTK